MKVVEFVGLPCVGKSTLCKAVIDKYKKDKKHIYTYNDLTYEAFSKKRRIFLCMRCALSSDARKFYRALNAYANQYDDVGLTTKLVIFSLYANIKRIVDKEKYAAFILDEGFVQNITSIAHMNFIEKDDDYYRLIYV